LIELALFIKANEALAQAFASESVTTLQTLVADDSRFVEVKRRIADYVDRFGFRCMNELKLEEPDLHADPSFIYQALQNYVQHPPPTVAELRAREQSIRKRAEDVVAAKLSGLRLSIFRFVLKHARKTVKNRENLRLCRTKVFGIARRIYDGIGSNLHGRGMLASPRDVYLLRREELFSLLDASSTTRDWQGVVALRQADRAAYLASNGPDDRFVTRGAVYVGNAWKKAAVAASADGTMRGTGCCPGQVRAPAKVIRDPRGDLSMNGNILVAERTDPGWTPLFPSASGVLVERGSLLSHSAIVARELGIPCVVGVAGLLATVHTGDDVEMDGGAGTIRVHAASAAKAAE
ncbi:MAG TPA: PEP-utilizing enzyme, partial [Myxococcota bacterium]